MKTASRILVVLVLAGAMISSPMAEGSLRKCMRKGQTTYTNGSCPTGFTEKKVETRQLTVVPRAQASASASGAQTANAGSSLRDALDMNKDERMREKMIDRAVNGR